MVTSSRSSRQPLKFRRILLAVKELEAKSLPAVLKAAQLARACGAEVELFHTLATPVYADLYSSSDRSLEDRERALRQQALRRLETIADRLRQHSIPVSVSAEWDFPAYEAIVRRARRIKADLIVVQRHAGRHTAPWLLRLTDWELLRLSPMPVLLVKSARPLRHPVILAAVDPTHANAKPSSLDKDILGVGDLLSEKLRGSLHAVHAYARIPFGAMPPFVVSPGAIESVERQSEKLARKNFERVVGTARIAKSHRYLIGSPPVEAIREAARKSRCAIVVMGAISRSGLKRLLIGNTAEQILDDLSCDLMIVKPRRFRNKVARVVRGARVVMATPVSPMGYY
jgi:universal stress protein E